LASVAWASGTTAVAPIRGTSFGCTSAAALAGVEAVERANEVASNVVVVNHVDLILGLGLPSRFVVRLQQDIVDQQKIDSKTKTAIWAKHAHNMLTQEND